VVLADRDSERFAVEGVEKALKIKSADVRVFGKPATRKYRRMGVTLARGKSTDEARRKARQAAANIKIVYY
jgi:phosphoribosylglycinamide formyltransferase 2